MTKKRNLNFRVPSVGTKALFEVLKNSSCTAELKKEESQPHFSLIHLNAARCQRRDDSAKYFSVLHMEEEE